MDKVDKWLMFILAVVVAVIINQAIEAADVYFNNRKYDVELHQKQWAKEWPESVETKRQELIAKGFILEERK